MPSIELKIPIGQSPVIRARMEPPVVYPLSSSRASSPPSFAYSPASAQRFSIKRRACLRWARYPQRQQCKHDLLIFPFPHFRQRSGPLKMHRQLSAAHRLHECIEMPAVHTHGLLIVLMKIPDWGSIVQFLNSCVCLLN